MEDNRQFQSWSLPGDGLRGHANILSSKCLGQSKVTKFELAASRDEQVSRLDITMNNIVCMEIFQATQ